MTMGKFTIVNVLQLSCPMIVVVCWLGIALRSHLKSKFDKKTIETQSLEILFKAKTKILILILNLLIIIGHATSAVIVGFYYDDLILSDSRIFHTAFSLLLWSMMTVHNAINLPHFYIPGLVAASFEIAISILYTSLRINTSQIQVSHVLVVLGYFRGVLCILLVFPATSSQHLRNSQNYKDEEQQPLLANTKIHQDNLSDTDSSKASSSHESDDTESLRSNDVDYWDRPIEEKQRARLEESGGYFAYFKPFKIFWPYLIPKKDPLIQFCFLIMIVCLLLQRVLTVLIPRQLGMITDKLATNADHAPYREVIVWIFYQALNSGILDVASSFASTKIQSFSTRMLTVAAYDHYLHLSMSFHADTKAAVYQNAIHQGDAITDLLETVVADVGPAMVDMIVAYCYFYLVFGPTFSFVAIYISILYIWVSVLGTNLARPYYKEEYRLDNEEWETMSRGLHHWATITNFARENHETSILAKAVDARQLATLKQRLFGETVSNFRTALTLCMELILALVAVSRISRGQMPIGKFVTLITYVGALLAPLSRLANNWQRISSNLLEAERLLIFLSITPDVQDEKDAPELNVKAGHVVYNNVSFSYDGEKQALNNISIEAEPGQTIALVGTTGSGKSTTGKLLTRIYDVTGGSIEIDGQDIRKVTQQSLRDAIAIVEQEPSLFGSTIIEELRYAKLDATDEEIYDACRAAAIHDKIMTFPRKYLSRVGEGGTKVSGGEKQRIAIARAFLRNSPIVLLDEATSSVDSDTEIHIKHSLETLCHGRTTFVIAHRFSTILKADQILVFEDGNIIERGTHESLVAQGGKYQSLWLKQVNEFEEQKTTSDEPTESRKDR